MTNWTELKRLAEEATQGDWEYVQGGDEEESWEKQFPTITANDGDIVGLEGFYSDKERDEANAAFIAAANPKTILALIAENERLSSECEGCAMAEAEKLREERDSQQRICIKVMEENNKLRAEVEALLKDAERYRVLREFHWSTSEYAVVVNPKEQVKLGAYCPFGYLLDAAIDSEIAKTQP